VDYFDAFVGGGGGSCRASVPRLSLVRSVGDGSSGHLLSLCNDFAGRSDDVVHGIAVSVVKGVTVVFVVTLR
jgi:hypothetical protein